MKSNFIRAACEYNHVWLIHEAVLTGQLNKRDPRDISEDCNLKEASDLMKDEEFLLQNNVCHSIPRNAALVVCSSTPSL
jgi:hypothetical protein